MVLKNSKAKGVLKAKGAKLSLEDGALDIYVSYGGVWFRLPKEREIEMIQAGS